MTHAVNGTHGLLAKFRLIERSSVLEQEIASLEAVRRALKHDVALLAADPPHPDLVEEVARDVLGFSRPGDRVLIETTPRQR